MTMVTATQTRDQLRAVRERIGDLRGKAMVAKKRVEAASAAFDAASYAGQPVQEWPEFAEAQAAVSERGSINDLLNAAKAEEQALLAMMAGAQPLATPLVQNREAIDLLRNLAGSSVQIQNTALGPLLTLEQTLALTGRALNAGPVSLPSPTPGRDNGFLGIAPTPVAPTSLLDLFASVEFVGRKAEFLRRSGGIAAAGIQIEGALKTEASLVYEDDEAEARTVASWTKVLRQQLADIEGLSADMLLALRQGVLVQVEYLLIGSNPITGGPAAGDGILNAPGVVELDVDGLTLDAAVGRGKATLAAQGVTANFVAAHPLTIEDEEARTGNDGQPVKAIDDQGRIRRLPLVPTIALPQGEILMGDSRIGARLGVREPVTGAIGQEVDDMTRNRVTCLVEGRWAPIVDVPSAFAHATLDAG
jgi:hypothetical protein